METIKTEWELIVASPRTKDTLWKVYAPYCYQKSYVSAGKYLLFSVPSYRSNLRHVTCSLLSRAIVNLAIWNACESAIVVFQERLNANAEDINLAVVVSVF